MNRCLDLPTLLRPLPQAFAPEHRVTREPTDVRAASAGFYPQIVVPRSSAWVTVNGHASVVASPCSVLLLGAEDQLDRRGIDEEVFIADSLRVPEPMMQAFLHAQALASGQPPRRGFAFPWARLSAEQYLSLHLSLRRQGHERTAALHSWMHWVLRHAAQEWRRRPVARHEASRTAQPASGQGQGHSRFALAQAMAAYIEARWRSGCSLQAMAEHFDLSPFHLLRVFRRSLAVTPHQYLLQLRLRRSLPLIENPRLRIIDIALGMGFCSHGHYSTAFKSAFGITPQDYLRERMPSSEPATETLLPGGLRA